MNSFDQSSVTGLAPSATRTGSINVHEDASTIITVSVVVSFITLGLLGIFLFLRIANWSRRRSEEKRGYATLQAAATEKRRGLFGKQSRRRGKNAFDITEPYAILSLSATSPAESFIAEKERLLDTTQPKKMPAGTTILAETKLLHLGL